MSDSAPAATPKKAKVAKAKKPKTAPSHPKVSDMVTKAISTLKERGGSSLVAIKKYIGSTYKVDAEKLSPFIKKYLRNAVASGTLVQTKGKGASGSFRMGGAGTAGTKTKKPAAKAKKAADKPKAAKSPKKAAKPKKAAAKKPKSPAKAKKPKASPKKAAVKKPKPAKAKKPKASPKKAAAKKGKK